MKRFLLLFTLALLPVSTLLAARQATASGRVIDEKGAPVEFATVILLQAEKQVAGMTTDADGCFSLKVAAGDYTLRIQYVGYQTLSRDLQLEEGAELGDFVLCSSATEIEDVVVQAQIVRREADRFVVDVANSPVAVGKDGAEMLKTAPGVWIDNDKISINGKSGSKVYVNERELKMESEQLLTYLRSLRAEDIQKIEVIPVSGADYDADSSAGIIKITLKRKRDDGMEGSVSYSTQQGDYTNSHSPYGNINYHHGRFDLYLTAWGYLGDEKARSEERTEYNLSTTQLQARSRMLNDYGNWGAKIGGVAEVAPHHSIGAEFEYWTKDGGGSVPSVTEIRQAGTSVFNHSNYLPDEKLDDYSVALNYIVQLDTLGSDLKLLLDYTHRNSATVNDNSTRRIAGTDERDSLYRDRTDSRYRIFTANLAWEKVLSSKWQLRAGAKYTRNDMRNGSEYRYLNDGAWIPSSVSDYRVDYVENIAAAYAVASAQLGRFGITAGLRGEYTHTEGKTGDVRQNYFSLFPNANLAWNMEKSGKHMLIANYARTIARPSFWQLTPVRQQISDYTYQCGNPELEPSYQNDFSLTLVLFHKYTLTATSSITKGAMQFLMEIDPNDSRNLVMTTRNFPDKNDWGLSLTLPIQITKWWSWNTNAVWLNRSERTYVDSPLRHNVLFQCYTAMTFQLPAKFVLETSYFGQNTLRSANIELSPIHNLNFSLKKRLFNDRLTLSASLNNVLDRKNRFTTVQDEFVRVLDVRQEWCGRNCQFRITYNFRTGKNFRSRSVESGAGEEKGRL